MSEYEALLSKVMTLEAELIRLREIAVPEEGARDYAVRLYQLETELRKVRSTLVSLCHYGAGNSYERPARDYVGAAVVPNAAARATLQTGVSVGRADIPEARIHHDRSGGRRVARSEEMEQDTNMEFKVGKTIMSLLASLLVLCSLVLFGRIVYPYLSDVMKVVLMYALSMIFIVVGLKGGKGKYKTFFTALAGCGIGAFYVSSIISYFGFQIFGIVTLGVLTYLWIIGVAWLSRARVQVFSYICYLGILVSTGLCWIQFDGGIAPLTCYLIGVVTLYLFCRTDEYKKDAVYFVTFPVVTGALAIGCAEQYTIVYVVMGLQVLSYVAQRYWYKERGIGYIFSFLSFEFALAFEYLMLCDVLSSYTFLNVFYIILSLILSAWSFNAFESGFHKFGASCVAALILPVLSYGSFFEDYISYLPFVLAIFFVAYFINCNVMKCIGCGYLIAYLFSSPSELSEIVFASLLIVAVLEFCCLIVWYCFDSVFDRVCFMATAGGVLGYICFSSNIVISCLAFWMMVAFSILFNSKRFRSDNISMQLGWAWNGVCMAIVSSLIIGTDNIVKLVLLFIAALVVILINAKWQLEFENFWAGMEFCAKQMWFLALLMDKLGVVGVGLSIAFLLLAVWCIILGGLVRRKSLRVYGLTLSVISVFKCLVVDISYSSDLYRPIGILVAGLLCFGISWIYTILERKLRQSTNK